MLALHELLPGGYASGRSPAEFDPVELARGIRVEMEHTNDWRIAREIAMDHLTEDPRYYQKLARMHLDGPRLVSGLRTAAALLGVAGLIWFVTR